MPTAIRSVNFALTAVAVSAIWGCGDHGQSSGTNRSPSVTILTASVDFDAGCPDATCRRLITTLRFHNSGQTEFEWGWASRTGRFEFSPSDGSLAPGESLSVGLFFLCNADSDFADQLTVMAMGTDEQATDIESLSVRANIASDSTVHADFPLEWVGGYTCKKETTSVWIPLRYDFVVDSSRIYDARSGEELDPYPRLWCGGGGYTIAVIYEGRNPDDTTSYGAMISQENCVPPHPCLWSPPIPCEYRVWISCRNGLHEQP